MQFQDVRQAQFVGQSEDGIVAGEEMVVEVFQRPIPLRAAAKTGRQPAEFGTGLVDRDLWSVAVCCVCPSSVVRSRVRS